MRHASLFSGIGGPEVAAAMLGWENVFHCEINPFGRAVLEYWFPESKSYEDITKTNFSEWRGKVDVLTGGFPCQPFSYAGKRGGREDERYLWPQMLRVIDEVRPTWVVGENVAGITTMVEGGVLTPLGCDTTLFGEGDGLHRYELRESFTIERICRDLEGLGYSVQPVLIPAAAVGAPHRRDRVFILAHAASDAAGVQLNAGAAGCRRDAERQTFPELGSRGCANAANSNSSRQQESEFARREKNSKKEGAGMDDRAIGSRRDGCFADSRLLPGNKWHYDERNEWIPTVSPVHSGNDGLSIRMDGASIPFTNWRTESLKAYGNAIVPQVMYEIFRAIEQV